MTLMTFNYLERMTAIIVNANSMVLSVNVKILDKFKITNPLIPSIHVYSNYLVNDVTETNRPCTIVAH
jgi:hypothetical protein